MKKHVPLLIATLLLVAIADRAAMAEKIFGTVWLDRYVPGEPSADAEESWATAAKKAKCYVCHVKGKSKKYCNTYGDVLSEWLKSDNYEKDRVKAEEEKVQAEILQALGQAESLADKGGTTFGELFRDYKLPSADPGPRSTEKEQAAAEDEEDDDDDDDEEDDDDDEDEDEDEDDEDDDEEEDGDEDDD
jgi:hypothetical protein